MRTIRLWSISPSYLDRQELKAVWHDALIVQSIICEHEDNEHYHPQAQRFLKAHYPALAIGHYLTIIYEEAAYRNFKYDFTKIHHFHEADPNIITVTDTQVAYEFAINQRRLSTRNQHLWLKNFRCFEKDMVVHTHPSFVKVHGPMETWEKKEEEQVYNVIGG